MREINRTLLGCMLAFFVASCNQPAAKTAQQETLTPAFREQDQWVPLFNHENLEGWEILPGGSWEVAGGILIGKSLVDEPLHGILLSDRTFGDFKLKVTYKAIKGNSGVYFRVDKAQNNESVHGLQAEIDPDKDAGGLYDTGGRMWVVQPAPEKVKTWYKPNDWNEMEIRCHGREVSVVVNGIKTAHLENDPGNLSGYIGLQLHGNMDMQVMFKEILISEF